MRISFKAGWAPWARELAREIEQADRAPREGPFRLKSFTVLTLPAASDHPAGVVYVSDETGGATLAFSDGSDWRRVQDRAVVS